MSVIEPTTGPVWGGTLVQVAGSEFLFVPQLTCGFGTDPSQRTVATFMTSTRLRCYSPASIAVGTVALEISNNNQDFTSNGVQFEFQGMLFSVMIASEHV